MPENISSANASVMIGTGCYRLPGWVVSGKSVNEFKRNLDHYLRDNRGFKKVMITLSLLEPSALSTEQYAPCGGSR